MTISHHEHRTDSVDTPRAQDRPQSRTAGTGTTGTIGRWARSADPRREAAPDTRKAGPGDIAAAYDAAVAEERERTSGSGRSGRTGQDRLLSQDVAAQLTQRLDRALGGFVDDPRGAVREADAVLEETLGRLAADLRERRSALRASWHAEADAEYPGQGQGQGPQRTEELRLALRDYRDLLRRLAAA
ncbi:hypothetical protein ACWCYY_34230 [Kitasatospora sp. NPDC001664]